MSSSESSNNISTTVQWQRLKNHASDMSSIHLRSLLADRERCASTHFTSQEIMFDFSRQRVTGATIEMLFDLAEVAGLDGKKTAMACGEHINSSEDRAVMHIALRAPRSTILQVDGVDVVPDVHRVLDAITVFSEDIRSGRRVSSEFFRGLN